MVYNDYPTSPNKKGLPDGHAPIARIMSTPVVQHGKVRLIFGVGDKSTDYTAWDVLQAQSIARELHRILEKRDLEKRLKKTETTWHFAIEAINEGIWDWNMLTDEVFFSSRWKEMLGYAPHEIARHFDEWKARVHPDDLPVVMATLEQHLSQEIPTYLTEHRMRCKDGSWKWIMDRGKVLDWTKEGRPARMVGTHREITERKQI
ncbi:MAG: PAS domain-containing protein [Candidatus Marinimicrobia bacterium]|nr:PAS domain-containing protein [Candidatus Neomarinimicrobiota bacterium]